jgi:hypothetical protein
MQESDFHSIEAQPIPDSLLDLPLRDNGNKPGPSWRFTHSDWGFLEHPSVYVAQAEAGDKNAQELVNRGLKLFLDLMELDVQQFDKLNPLNGQVEKDERGKPIKVLRSQWREDPAFGRRVAAGNVALSTDHWFNYVRRNWYTILPKLRWFDPEPSTDPENPHTAQLIARKMHPGNPQRAAALKFLARHNLATAERAEAETGGKQP